MKVLLDQLTLDTHCFFYHFQIVLTKNRSKMSTVLKFADCLLGNAGPS